MFTLKRFFLLLSVLSLPLGIFAQARYDASPVKKSTSKTAQKTYIKPKKALSTGLVFDFDTLTLTTNKCAGECNASATVIIKPKLAHHTVTWTYPSGKIFVGDTATKLCEGFYIVTVRNLDALPSDSIIIQSHLYKVDLLPTIKIFPVATSSCFGECNGKITTSPFPSGVYKHHWSTGATTQNISNLCPSAVKYTDTVTDSKGCKVFEDVLVSSYPAIKTNPVVVDLKCNGVCDGSITLNTSGGGGSYTIKWSNGQTGDKIQNLCKGSYIATITDNNGCSKILPPIDVKEPSSKISITTLSVVPTACFEPCTGEISVKVTGGVPPYTYNWAPGTNPDSSKIRGLCKGGYVLTLTDANSCAVTPPSPYIIDGPDEIKIIKTQKDITCFGANDGNASVVVSGGLPSYTIKWMPGNLTGANVTNLGPGTYTVTVIDSKGCTKTDVVTITEPKKLVATVSSTDVTCFGDCNGTATVSIDITTGTPPHTVNWVPGNITTNSISNLCKGTYTVTVRDKSGCSVTQTATVNSPPVITTIITKKDISCFGKCDGSIKAKSTAGGNGGPYTYKWAPGGETTDSIGGLCKGSFTLTITDPKGCTMQQTVTISEPTQIVATLAINQIKCNGVCDGAIAVSAIGGSPLYTYLWNNGNTTAAISNLCAGTYNVVLTDSKGCSAIANTTLIQPTALSLGKTAVDISCNGICDGSASVLAGNGTTPYTYLWLPLNSNQPSVNSLCAGLYTVTVADASGCTKMDTLRIKEPAKLIANATATDVNCSGACDGKIIGGAKGGTPKYVYTWQPSNITADTLKNLCPGQYTMLVTDAKKCTDNVIVTIKQPQPLSGTISSTSSSCSSCNGTATVVAAQGAGSYKYLWSTTPAQTAATATGLCPGSYTVTITDINGCTLALSVVIPPVVVINITASTKNLTSCFGSCDGIATANATGGSQPYIYLWSSGTKKDEQTATGLCAGTHTVIVRDQAGCFNTATVTLNDPPKIQISILATPISCNGKCIGKASATVTGGTGTLTYDWTPGNPNGDNSNTITDLCVGTYTLTVKDGNGCTNSAVVKIDQADPITIAPVYTNPDCGVCNGIIDFNPSGGAPPLKYLWNPAVSDTSLGINLCAAIYTVTVTDLGGCSKTYSVGLSNKSGPVVTKKNVTPAVCAKDCNGAAKIDITGGTKPYVIDWQPGSPTGEGTDTISRLCVGSYKALITDGTGCITIDSVKINGPPALKTVATVKNINCKSNCEGSITLSPPTGGNPGPYTYVLLPANTTSNVPSFTNLCAGNYSIVVKDSKLCEDTVIAFTITEPDALVITIKTDSVKCYGSCNGAAHATVTGGTPPYKYKWSNNQILQDVVNLCAGFYTLTVTDATGSCQKQEKVVIEGPKLALNAAIVSTNPKCFNTCDGSAQVNATGGTVNYKYKWTPGNQTGNVATNLCSGKYDVVVTDNYGCVTTKSVTLKDPVKLAANLVATKQISCSGDCNGIIKSSPTGGFIPYKFQWLPNNKITNGAIIDSLTGICAGTYTINITDANGCTQSTDIKLDDKLPLLANVTITKANCINACNGSLTANPVGGTAPFTYLWLPGNQTTNKIENLCKGSYTVTVTDASGCTDTKILQLDDPDAIDLVAAVAQTKCKLCDGTIEVQAIGGTPAYTYLWSNGETTAKIINLCSGVYNVVVTDSRSCTKQFNIGVGDVDGPVINPTSTDVKCFGVCDGIASVEPVDPSYDILWTPGSSKLPTIINLCAGTYIAQVTDVSTTCKAIGNVVVNEPTEIIANEIIINATCEGRCDGSIKLDPKGGTPGSGTNPKYTYLWGNGATTSTLTGLCVGKYTVTISDSLCSIDMEFTIGEKNKMVVTVAGSTIGCNGGCTGTATIINITGGAPLFSYLWNDPLGQFTKDAKGLCAGNYTVTITDADGCKGNGIATVDQVSPITITPAVTKPSCGKCDGKIDLKPTGGAQPYTVVWSTGQKTEVLDNLCGGIYSVVVTDASGCSKSFTVTLDNITAPVVAVATTNVTCAGVTPCDGAAAATISGGTAPYQIVWVPGGQTTTSVTNLCEGAYTVQVKDANACQVNVAFTIDAATELIVTQKVVNTQCGASTGSIDLTTTGGAAPYSYIWSTGQTTEDLTNLTAGNYTVTVTDSKGCSEMLAIAISNINGPQVDVSTTDPLCAGLATGSATATINGGTPGYDIKWSTGESSATITGKTAGVYYITVKDAKGCITVVNFTIKEPATLTVDATTLTTPGCIGECNGAIAVTATGGTIPYTYNWSPVSSNTSNIKDLCKGIYTVTVTDLYKCSIIKAITLADPKAITADTTIVKTLCTKCEGSITVVPHNGTPPYTYNWAGMPTEKTGTIINLCAGVYTVTVTDSKGCSQTFIIGVSNIDGPILSVTSTNAQCYNACDGTAQLTITGGSPNYIYLWTPGGLTTSNVSALCANTYIAQVTDAANCIAVINVKIDQPTEIIANDSTTNATCNGICDGASKVKPTGGTPPYTYLWKHNNSTLALQTGLCVGTYTVLITDSSTPVGCTVEKVITISEKTKIEVLVSSTPIACNGVCDGTAKVDTVKGGTPDYTYSWNDPLGQFKPKATGLCAGDYTVVVTDMQGCKGEGKVSITQAPAMLINPVIVKPACGKCDGTINLQVSGGTSPYIFTWNNGQVDEALDSLCAGIYVVIVTDATGCSKSFTLRLDNQDGPVIATSKTDIICAGTCNGTATVTATGNAQPFNYLWLPGGQTTTTLSNLCEGTYTIQVQDTNKCISSDTVVIRPASKLIVKPLIVNPTCLASTGSINLTTTGGEAPYTYLWSTGQTSSTLSGLPAGIYVVTVTDAKNCSETLSIAVTNTTGPEIVLETTDVKCNGDKNGSAKVTVTSSAQPVIITWSTGEQDVTSINNLSPGNYFVVAKDFIGCETVFNFTINEPKKLAFSLAGTVNPKCTDDCNGTITAIVNGGTIPYSYQWRNSGGTNVTAKDLCKGTYTVTVTDKNGCSDAQEATLTDPQKLQLDSVVTDATCNTAKDGAIDITVTGGTKPYSYLWSNGSTAEDLVNVVKGNYSVEVTDANGCKITKAFVINSTITVVAKVIQPDSICSGICVTLDASISDNATSYEWIAATDLTKIIGTNATLQLCLKTTGDNLYLLVAKNGLCTDTAKVNLYIHPVSIVDAGPNVTIPLKGNTQIGGTPTGPAGSTYSWSPKKGLNDSTIANPTANPINTTTYTVTVTNSKGCISTDTVVVTVLPEIKFPNGVTPNGDGKNEEWIIDNIELFDKCTVEIYNRWGELLFHSNGYPATDRWKGMYKGKPLPIGTYYYLVKLNDENYTDVYTGPITLMR